MNLVMCLMLGEEDVNVVEELRVKGIRTKTVTVVPTFNITGNVEYLRVEAKDAIDMLILDYYNKNKE